MATMVQVLFYRLFIFLFAHPILTQAQAADLAFSGTYRIRNCNAGQPDSLASALQLLLPKVYDNLQSVIADAALGTNSQHGFAALFKSNDNIARVQRTFQLMAKGAPVLLPQTEGRAINPLMNQGWPTLVCIKEGDPETVGLYQTWYYNRIMMAGIQDNMIVLFPSFWEMDEEAESFTCPRVRRNTLTPNDDRLVMNQQAILVHELAHLYGITDEGRWQDGQFESYLVGDAVKLAEQGSMKNAPNFAYFYAANQADCTRWPNINIPHDNLRGLLEVPVDSASSSNPILPAASATSILFMALPSTVAGLPSFGP